MTAEHLNYAYFGILLALSVIVVWTDRAFPILRDIPADPSTPHVRLPYSLARVQMALWTVVVVASLIYVLITTSSLQNIDASIVGLLGISGATGVLAGAVDVNKDKTVESAQASFLGTADAITSLDAQIVAALSQRDAAGQRIPAGATVMKLFADKADRVAQLAQQSVTVDRSQRDDVALNFVSDLLSDQNGNSLHRLQLVIFTLLFATYFVIHVFSTGDLKIPFSEEALGLMGVTGGVYVGFKVPGKST
jgi:hypothetical protein